MPIVRHNSEAIHCEDDAIVADVLSPFDVHRFLPRKLRPRYFHSATGNFCRGSSGCLEQFGKGMSRCLEVSYNGFRHLWLGSACRSEIAREKLKDAVFFLVHRLAVDQDHFHAERGATASIFAGIHAACFTSHQFTENPALTMICSNKIRCARPLPSRKGWMTLRSP